MSIPMRVCGLFRMVESEDEFRRLHPQVHKNFTGGHFTIVPCQCDPPCTIPTDDQLDELQRRVLLKPGSDFGEFPIPETK